MFRKIANSPLRKPLALILFLVDIGILTYCLIDKIDLAEGLKGLLNWMNVTIIGGYFTTSTIEHHVNSNKGGDGNER